jgi:hypothetical protein
MFTPVETDFVIAERVIDAFHSAREAEADQTSGVAPAGDLWADIGSRSHSEFVAFVGKRDVKGVAQILANALHHPVSRGLCWDESNRLTYDIAQTSEGSALIGLMIADRFIAFGEALGVTGVELAEYGLYGNYSIDGLHAIYEGIEKACGVALSIPECFGLFGIRIGEHTIHTMTPSHAYMAWRVDQVLDSTSGSEVCEIGGGYGGSAYFSFLRSPKRYTIIDLPVVNALQAYFLSKTCGPDNVRMFGEPKEGQTLNVLPYWEMANLKARSVDLVLNQESLPEIERAKAEEYIAEIERTTRGLFLSINHESAARVGHEGFEHGLVSDLVAKNGGFHRNYRFPTWIRRGHVEELYELDQVRPERLNSRTTTAATKPTA